MPLSAPAPREHVHTRAIEIRGFRRDDGLWDLEGHLTDVKTYGFENSWRGRIEPGTPLHEMRVRLTIDEDLMIHAAEAVTENGPFAMCPDITPAFARVAGIRIGPGWMRHVRELFGGPKGCTHIYELLPQMATTAYQTLVSKDRYRKKDETAAAREDDPSRPKRRPAMLDSCHTLASDSPVVRKMWPDFYTGPEQPADREAG